MKRIVSDLLQRYETGRLSRRELIQGLSLLAAAGASAGARAQDESLTATGIDHVSVLVGDLERSTEFYESLFGLSVLSEDKEHDIVRLGRGKVIVSLRPGAPQGTVDHFGVKVEGFEKEAVTRLLQRRGLEPRETWDYGYHVRDPDGVVVQIL